MNIIKLFFFIFMIIAISCAKKSTDNSSATTKQNLVESEDISEETNSIPIPVKLVSSDFHIEKEDDSMIAIEPCTPYYKEWTSNKRMTLDVLSELGYCDDLEYPVLDIYLLNNTDKTINITSLDFIVNNSEIDEMPYVYICNNGHYYNIQDIDYDNLHYYNCIIMRNESWFNWGKMNIDYKIMKRGEAFDGKYNRRKTIPYFEDEYLVNFTQDLVNMGLDMEFLHDYNYIEYDDPNDVCPLPMREFSTEELLRIFYPFEFEEDADFAIGFARIYGKISFTKSNFTKPFYGIIYITPPEGGAGDEFDDKFDVELKYAGTNYKYSYPYHTVLRPGDNESVCLTIKCPRSSNHRFYISIQNDNGLVMRTKSIQMHYLNGRHSTKQPMYTQRSFD